MPEDLGFGVPTPKEYYHLYRQQEEDSEEEEMDEEEEGGVSAAATAEMEVEEALDLFMLRAKPLSQTCCS